MDSAIQEAHFAGLIPIFAVDFLIFAKAFRMRGHFARIKTVHSFAEDVDIFLIIPIRVFKIECSFGETIGFVQLFGQFFKVLFG